MCHTSITHHLCKRKNLTWKSTKRLNAENDMIVTLNIDSISIRPDQGGEGGSKYPEDPENEE